MCSQTMYGISRLAVALKFLIYLTQCTSAVVQPISKHWRYCGQIGPYFGTHMESVMGLHLGRNSYEFPAYVEKSVVFVLSLTLNKKLNIIKKVVDQGFY